MCLAPRVRANRGKILIWTSQRFLGRKMGQNRPTNSFPHIFGPDSPFPCSPQPTQPLPDTPAPSHLFETHNMGSDTQPTAPQMPSCEICDKPAQLQCGICKEMFFCDKPACYDACHPRKRDREAHRASVTAYGTSSKCAHHPGLELSLVCEDPACGDALICMHCAYVGHTGHKTVYITDYMKRQRDILHSHVADLTAQRTDAKKKCRVLEELPHTEDRYKDLLLQTHVEHLVMREDVSRSEVVCEEEVARSFLTQALSREGEVCALKTFVAKAGHMIAECEAVCQLGDDQVLRAVTESQAVVRNINSMAASGDRHRLVGAADPHATFSLKLPISNVHDALAQKSVFVMRVSTQQHPLQIPQDIPQRLQQQKQQQLRQLLQQKLPQHSPQMQQQIPQQLQQQNQQQLQQQLQHQIPQRSPQMQQQLQQQMFDSHRNLTTYSNDIYTRKVEARTSLCPPPLEGSPTQ